MHAAGHCNFIERPRFAQRYCTIHKTSAQQSETNGGKIDTWNRLWRNSSNQGVFPQQQSKLELVISSSTPRSLIMSNPNSVIPKLGQQPATVDFIENRLPKYHGAFVDSLVRFDSMSGQYVPKTQVLAPMLEDGPRAAPGTSNALLEDYGIPPRSAFTDLAIMEFWKRIIPEAIDEFRKTAEPKGWAKTDYNIRNKNDWDKICDTLELARMKYEGKGGAVGFLRKARRKFADNVTTVGDLAKITSKLVPSNPYATPVLCAVVLLLDAAKTAADVRQRVLQGFDGLVPIFSDVELFLQTFQGDLSIRKATVDLTATILSAIERAIGFFVRNEFMKGGKALFTGSSYEQDLLEGLEKIQEKSKGLMTEAIKSHIYESHIYSQETRKLQQEILKGQQGVIQGMHVLLSDFLRQYEHNREQELRRIVVIVEDTMQRGASPIPFDPFPTPPPQMQAPLAERFIGQNLLRQILETFDIDLKDINFITDMKNQFPAKQRALSEQVVRTHRFRNWIVSPVPAKLLVQWDSSLPKIFAGISPLSLLCMNIIQAVRAKEQFISTLWFCGRHEAEPAQQVGGRAMVASLIDQLLRQHIFDTRALHHDVDPAGLYEKSLETMLELLGWLVRQLPPTTTLFFIIDGISVFEQDCFEYEALEVFLYLLKLTPADPSILANIKVLFTSTPGTDIVWNAFENEDLILNVHTLPQLGLVPNDDRVAWELEGVSAA